MLKIQQSRMIMKKVPSRRARCVDSGGMFGFQNGLRMRKLRHSEVLWK